MFGGWTPTYTKEVTGNWYIDLTDAVVNKLLELKAYGWCEQASTPTPSTPVDIVCNNGALKVKDKELPVWYVRLESIDFDWSMHYDTGEHLFGADNVKITLSNSGSSWRNVFGCYTTTSATDNFSLYVYPSTTSQVYFRYWDALYRPIFWTGTRTITFWSGGTTGFYSGNVTAQEQTFETSVNAYIWALPNSSSAKLTGTIYWNIEVTNNGTTRLKWIPCKRKSDGVIWYYEAVNWNFIEPSGSGTPVAWAEDYSNIEVYVDGTTEKIWARSENAKNLFTTTGETKDKFLNASGVEQNGVYENYQFSYTDYLPVLPNTTYTFSVRQVFNTTLLNHRINEYSENKTWIKQGANLMTQSGGTIGGVVSETFTTSATTKWLRINYVYNPSGENPQLEVGNQATTYEPYYDGWTATCEDLLWVWTYLDEQEILSGNVVVKNVVMVLDWTENWSQATTSQGVYRYRFEPTYEPKKDGSRWPCVSTHFVDISGVTTQDVGGVFASTTYLYFIPNQDVDTVAKWTTFLANQLAAWTPVIVVYPLATPTTLSVAWQHLSIPAWDSRIEIVEWSILDLPLYAKYKSTTE